MAARTVLITCVGGYYAYDTVRALRMDEELQLRVVGVDADSEATGRLFVDSFHTVPMAATDPDSFVESLLEICLRKSVDIVIPGADEEVYALADAKQRFEVAGAKCTVADNTTLALTRDKVRVLETISDHGLTQCLGLRGCRAQTTLKGLWKGSDTLNDA